MKAKQKRIGRPGYRALLQSIREADTQEQAAELLFASDVLTHEEKQAFLDVHVAASLVSPMRNIVRVNK